MRIFRRRKPRRNTVQCVDCGTWLADTLKTFPEFDHQPLCIGCLLLGRSTQTGITTPPWMKYDDNGSGLTTTPRYYAKVGDQLTGPHPSYTEALRAAEWRRWSTTTSVTALLDLGSITVGDGQFGTLLQSDPVLRAVFELGRQHERMAADLR